MNIEIANNLVQLRKKNGLSQEALADKLGISRQAVSKWERAEASPDTDNLVALAKLYGISLNTLLLMDGNVMDEGEKTTDEKSEDGKPNYVHIGFDGIHVKDDKDEVHIGKGGIHVDEKDGHSVHIADGKVNVDGKEYDKTKYLLHKFPFAPIIILVYLCLGLSMNAWHPAWLLFLTIPLYHSVADCIIHRSIHRFAYPVLAALVYLLLGVFFSMWSTAWIVFLTIPIFYMIFHKKDEYHEKY